jgi:hypothetical protein
VFHSNAAGAAMLLLTCWVNGELSAASALIADQPVIMLLLVVMGSCGCIGLPLYLLIVADYVRCTSLALVARVCIYSPPPPLRPPLYSLLPLRLQPQPSARCHSSSAL